MERQPNPLDSQGLPFVPLAAFEVDCGGAMCEDNPNLKCPDEHHLYAERSRFAGFTALSKLANHPSMRQPMKRCQHVYLHKLYGPAPEPSPSVVAVEIERRGIKLNKAARKQLRKRIQDYGTTTE